MSWRNPGQQQGHFDLDTYAGAVAAARDAVASIAAQPKVNLAAGCSGGIITAGLLGQLAASDELGFVASLTLMVCALDNQTEGTMSALASRDVAAAAVAESAREGYLDGQALAGVFTWLRPNDLVWNYVVKNYLLGKAPPAFDILYWNQDTVRLAAGLHRDFIHIGLDNAFTHPGELEVLGQPVDLGAVDIDTYFVAGISDHIVPWESAYKGARLFGGNRRFVSREAVTSSPSSTRRARNPARASASPTTSPPSPMNFLPRRRSCREAGGPTWLTGRRRTEARAEDSRQPQAQSAGEGTRHVCPRKLSSTPARATTRVPPQRGAGVRLQRGAGVRPPAAADGALVGHPPA